MAVNKSLLKGHYRQVRERSQTIPYANESALDQCSDIPESRKNRTIESNPGCWLIAACTCEELEGLNDELLDGFKVVYFYDQFGGLHSSEKKLFISHVVCSGIDPGFRWKVPGGFGALPSRFKVAWLAGFDRSAVFFLPDCTEVAAEENCPFVRRLPIADSRFDAPEDLSLKLLFQLDGEHSSDGEVFDYRKSDSLRDLTAKLSVCSIVETDFYLIDATGLGKRVGKIL